MNKVSIFQLHNCICPNWIKKTVVLCTLVTQIEDEHSHDDSHYKDEFK